MIYTSLLTYLLTYLLTPWCRVLLENIEEYVTQWPVCVTTVAVEKEQFVIAILDLHVTAYLLTYLLTPWCRVLLENIEEYKSTSAQQSVYYYHIGVKMDNMFRLSGSHHQVQYKDAQK